MGIKRPLNQALSPMHKIAVFFGYGQAAITAVFGVMGYDRFGLLTLIDAAGMVFFARAAHKRLLWGAYGLAVLGLLGILVDVQFGHRPWLVPPIIYLLGAIALHRAKRREERDDRPIRAEDRLRPTEFPVRVSSIVNETLNNVKYKSYFIRHWRGNLSLTTSYWINTILVSLIFTISLTALLGGIDITQNSKVYSLLAIALLAIPYLAMPWQYVGCWRSALNHEKKTCRAFWPRVVRVLLVIGTMVLVRFFFSTAMPQANEYIKIVLESDSYSNYTILVLRHGTEMEVSGGIGFGLTDDVRKHLEANPNIRVIHLNSIGGRVAVAKKLHDLIRSRQLITYSSRGCFSACVWAFLGGSIRVLNKNAKLGFHQAFFPGLSSDELAGEIEADKRFFISAGVDASFVQKAFSTPSHDIWEPSTDELLKAGVITQVSDSSQFAMSEAALWSISKKIESALLEIPIYGTIKTYDPKSYDQILKEFQNSIKRSLSKLDLITRARAHVGKVLKRFMPYAADDALAAFTKVVIEEINQLKRKSGDLCYALIFPQQSRPVNYKSHFSKELRNAEVNAVTRVIETAATDPQPVPSEKQVSTTREGVYSELVNRFGDDAALLANLESPDIDKACTLTAALYEEILKLPKKDSGKVLRRLTMRGRLLRGILGRSTRSPDLTRRAK